jgi:hypothetical protein
LWELGDQMRQFSEKLHKNDQQPRQQTQAKWRNCSAREPHPIPRDLVQTLFRHPQNETPYEARPHDLIQSCHGRERTVNCGSVSPGRCLQIHDP